VDIAACRKTFAVTAKDDHFDVGVGGCIFKSRNQPEHLVVVKGVVDFRTIHGQVQDTLWCYFLQQCIFGHVETLLWTTVCLIGARLILRLDRREAIEYATLQKVNNITVDNFTVNSKRYFSPSW